MACDSQIAAVAASRTIGEQATSCIRALESLCDLLTQSAESTHGLSVTEALDHLGQLRIWANNLGALQPSTSPRSLDHRLREAPKFAAEVVSLLEDLRETVEDVYAIASGERENRRGPASLEIDAVTPSSPGQQESAPGRYADGQEHEEMSEILDLFQSIPEVISRLFKLSMLIRDSSSRDRYSKASAATSGFPLDPRFDIAHVQHRFPRLGRKGSEWLGIRLGKAITQRRQYLIYCREHREKIGRVDESHKASEGGNEQDRAARLLGLPERLALRAVSDVDSQTSKQQSAGGTMAHTAASTVDPTKLERPDILERLGDELQDSQSTASFASTRGENSDETRLSVIQFETVAKPNVPFECPYCWTIQKFKRHRQWKKHVLSDLRPYVCTAEECDMKLFADPETWLTHELQNHLVEFSCCFCSTAPFDSFDRFHAHVTNAHGDAQLSRQQVENLAKTCRRSLNQIKPSACRICETWDTRLRELNPDIPPNEQLVVTPYQYQSHLRGHLEQLALFAIPRGYYNGDDAESGAAAQGDSRSSSPSSDHNPRGFPVDGGGSTLDPPFHLRAYRGWSRVFLDKEGILIHEHRVLGLRRPLVNHGTIEKIKRLLMEPGPTWGSALGAAAAGGKLKDVEFILDLYQDSSLLEWQQQLPRSKAEGYGPLHWVAGSQMDLLDAFAISKRLLAAGFDPLEPSIDGQTPLEISENHGRAFALFLRQAARFQGSELAVTLLGCDNLTSVRPFVTPQTRVLCRSRGGHNEIHSEEIGHEWGETVRLRDIKSESTVSLTVFEMGPTKREPMIFIGHVKLRVGDYINLQVPSGILQELLPYTNKTDIADTYEAKIVVKSLLSEGEPCGKIMVVLGPVLAPVPRKGHIESLVALVHANHLAAPRSRATNVLTQGWKGKSTAGPLYKVNFETGLLYWEAPYNPESEIMAAGDETTVPANSMAGNKSDADKMRPEAEANLLSRQDEAADEEDKTDPAEAAGSKGVASLQDPSSSSADLLHTDAEKGLPKSIPAKAKRQSDQDDSSRSNQSKNERKKYHEERERCQKERENNQKERERDQEERESDQKERERDQKERERDQKERESDQRGMEMYQREMERYQRERERERREREREYREREREQRERERKQRDFAHLDSKDWDEVESDSSEHTASKGKSPEP